MSVAPLLSIVVLAWNNVDLTRTCLESLRAHTEVEHELVVVDNGSTDGGAAVAESLADIAVLNETNTGFAAGMNAGLARASGRYVAFVNNDTVFPKRWAAPVLETLESNDSIGIVAPAVSAAGNPVTVRESVGTSIVTLTPFAEFPSGVVYVMPTDLARALGGWNEMYDKASAEDLDLAFTVWAHGYDVVVDERVLIQHVSQASVKNLPDRKDLYRHNLDMFLSRWADIPLGPAPRVESLSPDQFVSNQERARTAVIWIRRMLEAREEARMAKARLGQAATIEPRSRRWFKPRS